MIFITEGLDAFVSSVYILMVIHFVLKIFNFKFRQWVYLTIITISIIGISIHLIEKFIKKSKRIKLTIGFICAISVILCKIFWKKVGFIFFFLVLIINPKKEYVVEIQGHKYIASVEFLNTTVYFHEYVNSFIMASESEFEKYYKGSYDPIATERENEKIKKEEQKRINIASEENAIEQTKTEIVDSANILYEKEI